MDRTKYVRTKLDFIMFTETISHDTFRHMNPISAGFVCQGENGLLVCYGRSVSLNIDSRPDDTAMINRKFFNVDENGDVI